MTIAFSHENGTFSFARKRVSAKAASQHPETIHWDRVVKLPAFVLLLTAAAGLSVAGHTAYVEAQTDRILARSEQIVANALQASGSVRDQNGPDPGPAHKASPQGESRSQRRTPPGPPSSSLSTREIRSRASAMSVSAPPVV